MTQRLFIGGEWVEPDGGYYDVVNPATEEVVGQAPEASREQVYAAAAAAREAFTAWSRTKPEERSRILEAAADVIQREAEPYAALAQAESGATTATARGMQVAVGAARFRRYAKGALEPVEQGLPPQINAAGPMGKAGVFGALALRRPVGVVTCITSYNNPWANPAGKVAPALAMGNTVVVKPAPQDPLSVYKMAEALAEAGAPPGVVNVVTGSAAAVGEAAVDSPDVDMVSFTGSTAVGQRIAEVCGRGMKRQLMELGGKGAALVFDDADVDLAVMGIGTTFSFYSGQICTAPTRVIAQRGIYDLLVEKLTGYLTYMKVGDPAAQGTVVGPVISAAHRDRVESYIELGKKEGARLVAAWRTSRVREGFLRRPDALRGLHERHAGGAGGDLRPGGGRGPLRRRGRGCRAGERQRLRPDRLRLVGGRGAGVPDRRGAPGGRGRREHDRPEHGGAVRGVQEERGGPGRGLVRAARVQRAAGGGLAGLNRRADGARLGRQWPRATNRTPVPGPGLWSADAAEVNNHDGDRLVSDLVHHAVLADVQTAQIR